MDKFQQRFIDEAGEYFEKLELILLSLESDFSQKELIEEVFRVMHSLKGSGAMFGFTHLSEATHDLESLYDMIRAGEFNLGSSVISFTFESIDLLKKLLKLNVEEDVLKKLSEFKEGITKMLSGEETAQVDVSVQAKVTEKAESVPKGDSAYFISFIPHKNILQNGTNPLYLIDELHTLGECVAHAYFEDIPPFEKINPLECYIKWRAVLRTQDKLNEIEDIFLFVKEEGKLDIVPILNDKLPWEDLCSKLFELPLDQSIGLAQNEGDTSETEEGEDKPKVSIQNDRKSFSSIRVNSDKIDEYINLVSEMITAQSRLMLLSEDRNDVEMIALSETFQKLIRQLRDNAFNMSLVPLLNLVARFKRLVRDLSSELNKEVELITEGLETEVDKNMIEMLTDPMLHIIRNCIDHGIESPAERVKSGKTSKGTINVKASYVGTFVQIEILDDGAGLNYEKIKEKAIEKGMLEEDSEVSHSELVQLIFKPGFSTTTQVSDVSGRGVGMDVAWQAIKNLRGEVEVDSKEGEGTHITIRVPLTLSIIDGLLTKVNNEYFVVPTSNIEKIYALREGKKLNDYRKVVVFDGMEIPYLNLRKEFDPEVEELTNQYFVSVSTGKKQLFGLIVDEVVREYQAVVKPLGKMLKRHDMFLGASILGDGKLALVLDTKKIIQNYSS